MHFTLPLLALLSIFQAIVALPTPFSALDTPIVLTRRGNEVTVGGPDAKTIEAKCVGGLRGGFGFGGGVGGFGGGGFGYGGGVGFGGSIWGQSGFPFSQNLFNGLMGQFGFAGICSPFMGPNFPWGTCNVISSCIGGFNTFQNVFLPGLQSVGGFGGGFGGVRSIYGLNEQDMKSDTNSV